MFSTRMSDLRARMAQAGIDVALITDDDNVYYLTGYYNYLHMEFGRPTILAVPRDGKSVLITPTIDGETARSNARVDRIALWNVIERRDHEILLEAPSTGTASWLSVEPHEGTTRLLFGSWVRELDQSGWRFMQHAHEWYSRVLLGGL